MNWGTGCGSNIKSKCYIQLIYWMIYWSCWYAVLSLYLYCCCILLSLFYTPEYIYSCSYALYGMHYFMHGCDIITWLVHSWWLRHQREELQLLHHLFYLPWLSLPPVLTRRSSRDAVIYNNKSSLFHHKHYVNCSSSGELVDSEQSSIQCRPTDSGAFFLEAGKPTAFTKRY